MASGAARRTERLMCLVFLLKARGRRGITRAELRRAIDDYAHCASDDAFERMLERDKRDLRDAGIDIEVVQRDAWHEDEHAYVLGPDSLMTLAPLNAEELRVLALAAQAWERGSWRALALGALHKLEVFGDDLAVASMPRFTVNADAHLDALRNAVRARQLVRFDYRRPGDSQPAARRVEPWGLLSRQGGWYCIGWDRDRQAVRVFRTSRITSQVQPDGLAQQPPAADWPALMDTQAADARTTTATLLIETEHGWLWRARGRQLGQQRTVGNRRYDLYQVEVSDRSSEIGGLATAAPAVLVQAPDDLRERVLQHLGEERTHG